MSIWIIFGAFALLSYLISNRLESKFKKYSKIPMNYGMTGKDVAEKMLYDNDIHDVKVVSTQGTLTDHYNPATKTINLSHDVYYGNSVAAAAVAAHETGHAVQHATAYSWLQMRSSLVPIVSFASQWVQWVLLAGILLINIFPNLLLIGICLFALTTLFSIVTLPVEVNASKRALVWLNTHNITSPNTHGYAEDALRWAAYTYFVAALTSLATLIYYIFIYLGRRD
ncbi:MAG: zinc metallopeptidase [Bacteroidales bacterium]|jgi:Zn-dependent membrane protease YugP|nr:zinc metallopeptidase [Bacteroidales bacterium]MBR5778038.1 zinc metallopeptidase [Bacteroidales bacterium]